MTIEMQQKVTEWCKSNRQWGRELNYAHAVYQCQHGPREYIDFWRAVAKQYRRVESHD